MKTAVQVILGAAGAAGLVALGYTLGYGDCRCPPAVEDPPAANAEGSAPTVRPPVEMLRDCVDCPAMVVMPGGLLALGRYEVTVGEYRTFTEATGHSASNACPTGVGGNSWQDPGFAQTDRHPVTCVSWEDGRGRMRSGSPGSRVRCIDCQRSRNGNVRRPSLSRGATRRAMSVMGPAPSVPMARMWWVCGTWSGTCGSGLRRRTVGGATTATVMRYAAVLGAVTLLTSCSRAHEPFSEPAIGTISTVFAS